MSDILHISVIIPDRPRTMIPANRILESPLSMWYIVVRKVIAAAHMVTTSGRNLHSKPEDCKIYGGQPNTIHSNLARNTPIGMKRKFECFLQNEILQTFACDGPI